MTLRTDRYKVVINHEEQYSIVPMDQPLLKGWQDTGKMGKSTDCMKFIEEVWTDMKPVDRDRILRKIRL